jgi:hypothetical protein
MEFCNDWTVLVDFGKEYFLFVIFFARSLGTSYCNPYSRDISKESHLEQKCDSPKMCN